MGNLLFVGVPTFEHISSLIIMCLNIGTPNNRHVSFETNGKGVVSSVPTLRHFRVCLSLNIKRILGLNGNSLCSSQHTPI